MQFGQIRQSSALHPGKILLLILIYGRQIHPYDRLYIYYEFEDSSTAFQKDIEGFGNLLYAIIMLFADTVDERLSYHS